MEGHKAQRKDTKWIHLRHVSSRMVLRSMDELSPCNVSASAVEQSLMTGYLAVLTHA